MDSAVQLAPGVGIVALCAALGLSRATFYRRRRSAVRPAVEPVVAGVSSSVEEGGRGHAVVRDRMTEGATAPPAEFDPGTPLDAARNGTGSSGVASAPAVPSPPPPEPDAPRTIKRRSPRALSEEERAKVLALLDEERFRDLAPAEVYATLLDEGVYVCSERTMYRILDEHRQVRERRNQRRHPKYVAPELMAKKPNQLWSWDITKLKTFVKSQYLHLYVILDVFSRYVVGWMVADRESGELAKALIDQTCARQGIRPGELIARIT